MKRYRLLLNGLVVLLFAWAPALAQKAADPPKKEKDPAAKKAPKPKRPRKPKSGLRGYYAQIASVCKLTPEQVAKFKEALKPYFEAQKANKEKMASLRKSAGEARKAKEKDKAAQLSKELKALTDSLTALRAKAMDVLTPEQKVTWEGQLLYNSAMGRFKKTGIDEAQQKKIRALCVAKAKEAFDATDRKAKSAVRNALAKQVYETILTPEQQAKAKKPGAPRKPRKKKGGDKGGPEGKEKKST